MKATTEEFRKVEPADAPIVLEWEFGTRPEIPGRSPSAGGKRVPLVHAYRAHEGTLYEAVAPHHDWFERVREGDPVPEGIPGVEVAVLIDGGLWRPSTGPVFFPFASMFDAMEDKEAELRYASTVVMSTNYRPDIALGPIFCFSVLDPDGYSAVLGEIVGRPDLGPTAGRILARGDIPDVQITLLRHNAEMLLDFVETSCAGPIGERDREDLSTLVINRRLRADIAEGAVPAQQLIEAMPGMKRLVDKRIAEIEGTRERPRRAPARRRNLQRSEMHTWLRQARDSLRMLELQCEQALDRDDELGDLRL